MNAKELLLNEIEGIPESWLGEVFDFVLFLKARIACEKLDTALLSELSLSKDWLKPEEDAAWRDL